MIVLLGVALLLLLGRWAASLWGERGALLTLGLAAFCPHLLAHGTLVTSDLAATLGFTAALAAWWRMLHAVTPARVAAAGLATALLALSKFSAVLLAPVVVLLLALRLVRRTALPVKFGRRRQLPVGGRRIAPLGLATLAAAGIAWLGVWAGYGFRYSADPTDRTAQFAQPWAEVLIEQPRLAGSTMADGSLPADAVELRPGIVQKFVRWARGHELLPEAYLYGLAFTDRFSRHRLAYFAGEYRERGWREFFPAAFALKTTLPALALAALGLLAVGRHPRRARLLYRVSPLLVFAGVYGAFALTTNLNIGHRHLLPLYPALYLLAGAAVHFSRRRMAAVLIAVLALWHAAESWRVRPHYLTYFNQLAGGPTGGHRYFVDSSLDWGQGLPDLRDWLAANARGERVYLSYFGSDDPARLGINATRLGDHYFDYSPQRLVLPPLENGVYCISATMLHRVYTQVRGPWSDSYENEYRRLVAWRSAAEAQPPGARRNADGRPLDAAGWRSELTRLEQLRFGRLCRHLAQQAPDATVANIFFVYRLDATELQRALEVTGDALPAP
ncbi:MAG: hypothetical protein C0518_09860 [Opitutus sp.]|nr:hypothetical protein [Opitutus sp.]